MCWLPCSTLRYSSCWYIMYSTKNLIWCADFEYQFSAVISISKFQTLKFDHLLQQISKVSHFMPAFPNVGRKCQALIDVGSINEIVQISHLLITIHWKPIDCFNLNREIAGCKLWNLTLSFYDRQVSIVGLLEGKQQSKRSKSIL